MVHYSDSSLRGKDATRICAFYIIRLNIQASFQLLTSFENVNIIFSDQKHLNARRKIVEVILLNFRSNLEHKDKGRTRISMVWVPPLGFDPYFFFFFGEEEKWQNLL